MRIGLHWFVTRPFFDGFIMFVILLSSITLALEDPVKEDSEINQKLGYFDYGFTAIFAIECLLKMLDLGMFLHPGSYLRSLLHYILQLLVTINANFSGMFGTAWIFLLLAVQFYHSTSSKHSSIINNIFMNICCLLYGK